jgi:hypothetical protein
MDNRENFNAEDRFIDAKLKLAAARHFASMAAEVGGECIPAEALEGHYRILTEVYEFMSSIDQSALELRPIEWTNGECRQVHVSATATIQ